MTTDAYRKGLIASVHIAAVDMALDEATYREMLAGVTGHDSAGDCTIPQLKAMLAEFRARGWKPRPRMAKELRPLHRKITALLASLGRPRSYAEAIIRRQTQNGASLGTASRAQLTACVAALTRQQRREAPQEG